MPGLLNEAMPQEAAPMMPPEQGAGGPEATPATFLTLQVLKHFFDPESAQQWVQHAARGNPAEVIASIATQAAMASMEASGGAATEGDLRQALPDIVTSMVLFLVAAEVIPQEAAEQVATEAVQMTGASGGGEPQQEMMP